MVLLLGLAAWIVNPLKSHCDYSKVSGPIVRTLTNSSAPYILVGPEGYRTPSFDESMETWIHKTITSDSTNEISDECLPLDPEIFEKDTQWNVAVNLNLTAFVLGTIAAILSLPLIFVEYHRLAWRFVGWVYMFACASQACSLIWFLTEICDDNTCQLFWGSKADMLSIVLWYLAAFIMLMWFPKPNRPLSQSVKKKRQNSEACTVGASEHTRPSRDSEFTALDVSDDLGIDASSTGRRERRSSQDTHMESDDEEIV